MASRILIFGGTGTIGKFISEAVLASADKFQHISLFTSPATAASKSALIDQWKTKGLAQVIVGDVSSAADIKNAYAAVAPDTVVSALGRGALHLQRQLVEIADDASNTVKWFFPSEYGTDVEHNAKSPNEPPHQNKLALRKYIRENVRNLHITYLVTGPYFDKWVGLGPDPRAGGFDVPAKKAFLVEGNAPIGFCTMADVGKFLVASLLHPSTSYGKALKVQSFVVTPRQVLAEYEKQTGASFDVTDVPLAELAALEQKAYAEKFPWAVLYTLRRIWAEGGTLYAKNDNEAIGMSSSDVDSLAAAVEVQLAQGN